LRYLVVVASVLITSTALIAAPTHHAVKKTAAAPAVCSSLGSDYEGASKKLAMLKVESMFDDSAVRVTMRETESTNLMDQARMTMELMKNHGCAGPTAAPSADRYMSAALDCKLAETKASNAELWAAYKGEAAPDPKPLTECDQAKWLPK